MLKFKKKYFFYNKFMILVSKKIFIVFALLFANYSIQATHILSNPVQFIYNSTTNTNLLKNSYSLNILSDRIDPLRISYTKFLDLVEYIMFFSFNTVNPKIIKIMKSDLSITQKDFSHAYKSCWDLHSNLLFYKIFYNKSVNYSL